MGIAPDPDPSEIFHRAVKEGVRRLDQSMLQLLATGFIAGFTIVFGIVALAVAQSLVEPRWGSVAQIAGALAFGVGVVFLIVGRAELFNENFFDPVATAFDERGLSAIPGILRLWTVTFALNLVGGGLFVLIFSIDEVLSPEARQGLRDIATHTVERDRWALFASGIAGGSLIALLSFLLKGSNSVIDRIVMAYIVGVLLELGPFDHVIVSALYLIFGTLLDVSVGWGNFLAIVAILILGNLIGGVGLVTLSHVAQAWGAEEAEGD